MKNALTPFIASAIILFLQSCSPAYCGRAADTPESVARLGFALVQEGNYAEAISASHKVDSLNDNKQMTSPQTPTVKETQSPGKRVLRALVRFYQRNCSPVDGASCPMYPSCSAYSLQALNKHGGFVGFMMTSDRLMHEVNAKRYSPLLVEFSPPKYFDPVEANDFWFKKK